MPQTVAQGGQISLDFLVEDGDGNPVNPPDITVQIISPTNTVFNNIGSAVGFNVALGHYLLEYTVPANAPLGTYAARWSATVDGFALSVDDTFTVIATPSFSIDTFVAPPPIVDRSYVSRYSITDFGLVVHRTGVIGDADGVVTATFYREDDAVPPIDPPEVNFVVVSTPAVTHEAVGVYALTLSTIDTEMPGLYAIVWQFLLDGVAQEMITYIEVGPSQPVYDNLSPGMKATVDNVWIRFADLFDSPEGGPNLQTYYQTNWSRGRMAQLMVQTINRLNVIGQPRMSYTAYPPTEFPINNWGGLLELGLYIECLKHLIRSYTEQPNPENIAVARMDRRDYSSRWSSILQMEEADFERATETWRIKNMNLGRARVLVSGGAYGRFSPNRLPNSAAARPRFWSRFY